MRKPPLKIEAKFLPKGFRLLRPREVIEEGDWYWSPSRHHYLRAHKRIGEIVGIPIPYIRRNDEG